MYLGNAFADCAADVRGDEAAAAFDVSNRVGFADAAAYKILSRLVSIGCLCAALKGRRPPPVRRAPRPDLSVLVSSSRHALRTDGRSFRCEVCDILLSWPNLRAGDCGECVPVAADWRTAEGLPAPPPPNHPHVHALLGYLGFDLSHRASRFPGGGGILLDLWRLLCQLQSSWVEATLSWPSHGGWQDNHRPCRIWALRSLATGRCC